MSRAASFVADGLHDAASPLRYSRPPRLRGHLTHCLPHRHVAKHSFSFGPSSQVSLTAYRDYYGLC